jgi:hypothetical protein
LEIWSAFQQCLGPKAPPADELFEALDSRQGSSMKGSLLRMQGRATPTPTDALVFDCGDSHFVAAAVPMRPPGAPRWQAWRLRRGLAAPSQALFNGQLGFECTCSANEVTYFSNSQNVGVWSDWAEGIRERGNREVAPLNGSILRSPRALIEGFADQNGASFCWVCKVTAYYGSRYENKRRSMSTIRVFGASTLVRPSRGDLLG